MAWDVMSGVTKMAWDVMSGVTKTAWDVLSGVANLCGMFCPGCKKMAWDVLSWDVLSGSRKYLLGGKPLILWRVQGYMGVVGLRRPWEDTSGLPLSSPRYHMALKH